MSMKCPVKHNFFRFREISDLYETEKKKYGQKEARLYDIEAGIKRLSAQLEETETERNKLKTDNVNLRDANMRLKNVSEHV